MLPPDAKEDQAGRTPEELSGFVQEQERLEGTYPDFRAYQEICYGNLTEYARADKDEDEVMSYRMSGVIFGEQYELVLQDPETVSCTREDGTKLPVLIGIDSTVGYNTEQCRSLTATTPEDRLYLMSIAPNRLHHEDLDSIGKAIDGARVEGREVSIIFETPSEITQASKEAFSWALGMDTREFINEHAGPEYRTASIVLHTERLGRTSEAIPVNSPSPEKNEDTRSSIETKPSFVELVSSMSPALVPHETRLVSGEMVLNDKELLAQVWAIFEARFSGTLSEGHPVSMEEDLDFFKYFLSAEGTYAIVKNETETNDPRSVALFTTSLEPCIWLHPGFVMQTTEAAKARSDDLLYFCSVASTAKGGRDALDIMLLLSNTMAESERYSGRAHTLVYETTNLSDQYIPVLMNRILNRSGGVMSLGESKRSQLDYWFLTTRKSDI